MQRRRLLGLGLTAIAVLAGGAAAASERDDLPDPVEPVPSPATPVLSARRVPGVLAAPVADRRLGRAVDAVVARQRGIACLTVASGGRTVYERNADVALTPASVEKLVTAIAAFEVLGPEHRFRTLLLAGAAPVDGVVAGDLVLVGGGDPLLATAAYAARFRNQPQTVTALEALADALAAAGVTRVEGGIVGDESRYDTDRYPDAWPGRFVDQDQAGPLSALTVNDAWAAFPPSPDTRLPDESPAADPAAHAAAVLGAVLADRGITVVGSPGSGSALAEAAAVELAAVESPPLAEVVGQMLRESDNQTAELLLKELAVARGGPGTTAGGIAVAAEVVGGSEVVDGSGLAMENRISCERVQQLLDEWEPSLADALPIAGRTGTLTRRFLDSPVAGRMRAKTGSLNQVSALAGYLDTTSGAELSFSFIVNLPPELVVDEQELLLQEELAGTLARYPEGPSLEELGPR